MKLEKPAKLVAVISLLLVTCIKAIYCEFRAVATANLLPVTGSPLVSRVYQPTTLLLTTLVFLPYRLSGYIH